MYESRNVDDLRPDVAKNARKFIELCGAAGLPVSISSTVRDQEKQTEYYNKGTGSKTVSFHSVGSGLAFDIYHTTKGYDDIEFFKDCAKIGKEMGFEWGGDWTSLVDMPHFQWSENGKYTSSDIIAGRVPKEMPEYTESQGANTPTLNNSKYLVDSGIHIVEIPRDKFKLRWWDNTKRTTKIKNYFNASFFGNYKTSDGTLYTLPAGHVVADIVEEDYDESVIKDLNIYGKIDNGKIRMTFGGLKFPSTLIVTSEGTSIVKTNFVSEKAKYAVSGMPVIANGKDVSWQNDVITEGWDASPVYATWHGFLGVKDNDTIMYFALKTTKSNCIQSSEAYNKLKGYGCKDVIMLDGGGSFVLDVGGTNQAETAGSRQINTVGMF